MHPLGLVILLVVTDFTSKIVFFFIFFTIIIFVPLCNKSLVFHLSLPLLKNIVDESYYRKRMTPIIIGQMRHPVCV